MNAPHTHPRGTEILFSIDGEFLTVFVEENPSTRVVDNTVKPFMSTFFPQGVIHTQVNLSCEPASFIASFNSEDPGLVTSLQQLFLFEDDILEQSFQQPGHLIERLADAIPTNVAPAIEECHRRCKK
jgi:oxalate decarboxylase/phosphoglucose isomerase-like protein (cupin superfamily)